MNLTVFGAFQDSFNAVTPPGTVETGTVIDLGVITEGALLYTVDSGSGDDAYVGFDGSIDGDNWYSLTGGDFLISGPASRFTTAGVARYIRASGRTSSGTPVLTASIAPAAC